MNTKTKDVQPEIKDETPAAPQGPVMKRVVIQRPYGVTDSHLFIGFNDFEKQVAYDAPVTLPETVVNHLRSIRRVEYRAGEDGNPAASYSNAYAVIDAPDEE